MKTQEKILCERCCAAAMWQAILGSGAVMSFCNHHKNEHAAKFEEDGVVVVPVDGLAATVLDLASVCKGCVEIGPAHEGCCDFR